LPGLRFTRAARHVAAKLNGRAGTKEDITELFDSPAWRVDEATKVALGLVEEAAEKAGRVALMPTYIGARNALEARGESRWACVPPVDTAALDAREIGVFGFIGSSVSPIDASIRKQYYLLWRTHFLAEQIMRFSPPMCPGAAGSLFAEEITNRCPVAAAGACREDGDRTDLLARFCGCPIVDEALRTQMGENWASRVRLAE
jgi:hypothetical protein